MKKTLLSTRRIFCVVIILFFGITNASFAQTYNWVGSISNNFYEANNWDNTTLTFSDLQSYTFVIGAGVPNNLIHVGGSASDITKRPGRFNTTAAANVILKGNLIPWNSDYLNGIITLESPANVNIRSNVYLGKSANATLNLNGGSLYNRYAFYIGNGVNGNATANITAGALYVGTYLEIATGADNPTGILNIAGGTVDVPTAINIGANGTIFISGIGQLIVTGDKTAVLQDYITNGKITCPSGKTLSVIYDGSRTTVAIPQDSNSMLTEYPTYILLKNGIIEAKIDKNTSNLKSMKINGVETLLQTNTANPSRTGGYYDFTSSYGFETIFGTIFSVKEETADYIDVSFSRPYTPGSNVTPCDADIHYVLKKGDVGLYTYSILKHKTTYPNFDLGSWRQVLWINNTVTDKICVNDLKTWEMPQPTDSWEPTGIPEIIKITSGVRAGKYDGKYEFSEPLVSLKAYGHTTDKNSLGIWAVTANHEYFNSGPTHHDLNAASGIIHICMNGVHYNSKGFQVQQGEEWSKIYGPYLIYANQKATATANWDDAKARADKDAAEWPFSWLTNTPEYPLADGRGNITGNFKITDPSKPLVTGKNAWIGVTKLSNDSDGQWQFEEENYQYWVQTDATGNFDIKNVRPGTYTLFAYSDGVTGEYSMANVTVTAGGTNNLGNVEWTIARPNGDLLWEIGVPDRTSAEFKFGDFDYCEGFVQKKFDSTFPNPIVYNVADKNWSTALPYVHSKYYNSDGSINGNWAWKIYFDLPAGLPTTGNAKLTIAYASSDHAQQWIYVNTESGSPIAFYPPLGGGNAFLRQSNHAKYATTVVDIPMSKLHSGSNFIQLIMPSNSGDVSHLMYDYISFEAVTSNNDLDNDGVVNVNDTCPNTPTGESVDANGCSQSQLDDDNDGVKNSLDTCPSTLAGESVDANGCSQSQLDDDNDGVNNNLDTCPNTPAGETVNASGCSNGQLDDDNDGVINSLDACPNTPSGKIVDAKGCIQFRSNNFSIEAVGETCANKHNGQIIISATDSYNYVATINGTPYNLVSNALTVTNLVPGTYDICINVAGETAEQCYAVEIKAGSTITGKITPVLNKTNIEIVEGTAPYKVMVNGKLLFTTMAKNFDVANLPGDLIEVQTAVACEGVFSETINSVDEVIAYPNPTKGLFEIALPNSTDKVTIELYTSQLQLISQKSYPVQFGKVLLSLENQTKGVYFAKVEGINPVTLKIIKE